jgi:hypothetical protein
VDLAGLLEVLERDGILLVSDAALPSVVSLVVGEPVRGSWWGHPRGGRIYQLLNELSDDASVVATKLVGGKVTFVHRRLWLSIVAIGEARDAWQMHGLPAAGRELLLDLDAAGRLAWDDIPAFLPPDNARGKDVVRALEERLLAHAVEVHTPSGAHAKDLQTWRGWAAGAGLEQPWPTADQARHTLEVIVDELNTRYAGRARLPWRGIRPRALASIVGG